MSASTDQRVVITDSAELLAPGVELLRDRGVGVDIVPDEADPAVVAATLEGAPVAIVGVRPLDAGQIAGLRGTGLLIRAGIGYDIIDVPAATAAGIWVANVPDYCVDEVADHTLLLLMSAWRHVGEMQAIWRSGRWIDPARIPTVHRIAGRRLGVVGFGRIGRAVARRAAAFGWEIAVHDPLTPAEDVRAAGATPVDVDELFATSDAVTLHCPLTPETQHLVNDDRLSAATPGLVLVNTSRGGLVDLDAVDAALRDGRLGALGLDVVEGEPVPDLDRPLYQLPNVILTPHLAWYSLEARRDLALFAAEEAYRFVSGERPRNIVNPEARPAAAG